jgi:uncharacterized protein YjgD (DUF1641 family)
MVSLQKPFPAIAKTRSTEQAIFRIDLGRFLEKLSHNERLFIQSKAMDGLSDPNIKRKLGITFETLKAMKVNIRKQIQSSFGG